MGIKKERIIKYINDQRSSSYPFNLDYTISVSFYVYSYEVSFFVCGWPFYGVFFFYRKAF